MRTPKKLLAHIAGGALILTGLSASMLPAYAQEAVSPRTGDSQVASPELPDSPGAILARLQTPGAEGGSPAAQTNSPQQSPPPPAPAQSTAPPQVPAAPSQQQGSNSQIQSPQKPVGTAAAEAPNASGIAASQPAGVAIAPAKQRRVRTIVLRVGAIAGAGVAIGTVMALTQATPSKPPGAH